MDTIAIRLRAVTRRWALAGLVVFAALLVVVFGCFAFARARVLELRS